MFVWKPRNPHSEIRNQKPEANLTEHILIGIVSVIVLGIGAQWLAWRIRVPSILLLLVFGFLAGPVTGLLPPEQLQGIRMEVKEEEETLFDPSEPTYAFIFLVSPEDNPGQHLRTLAHSAGRVGEGLFIEAWRAADDEQALKEALMNPERYLSLVLSAKDKTAVFVGQAVQDLGRNAESLVALIKRNGQPIAAEGQTVLREGDQITITGNTTGIERLRKTFD